VQRREFITLLGGTAAAWPLAARAQQAGGARRIGWLIARAENDPASQAGRAALEEALAKLGWIEGRNLRIDVRFAADDIDRLRAYAAELVSLAPAVIVSGSAVATRAVQERTQTIPIVLVGGGDPAAIGLVQNIARPEGNTTGFPGPEPSIAGKWLELLKEAAPRVTRVAIVFNPNLAPTAPIYISLIEAAAPAFGVKAVELPIGNAISIVRALDAFAAEPNGGLLVLPPPATTAIRETIIPLAAQHRLPAIYPSQADAAAGGLLAYAANGIDQNRRAAYYVDRLLRGAKVSELPVQFPTKFELIVNLKTAKTIGLTIPESFLLRADELIE
jgi:putative tryptophan/tyrosine transport system substrate-binding protein